jgi:hypothetical protein
MHRSPRNCNLLRCEPAAAAAVVASAAALSFVMNATARIVSGSQLTAAATTLSGCCRRRAPMLWFTTLGSLQSALFKRLVSSALCAGKLLQIFGSVLAVGDCVVQFAVIKRAMSSVKRAFVRAASPLEHSGILLHVLTTLGPGHHLFISAVSKAWRESYKRVASVQMAAVTEYDYQEAVSKTITSHSTLCSAVFASVSRVRLAHECGLAFNDAWKVKLQRIIGRAADVATLRAAHELGLQLCNEVLIGAAEAQAASVPNLQWLHTEQGCWLPVDICDYAARAGSLDTLRWLRDHDRKFTARAYESAAAGGQQHVLQFLRAEGCDWDEAACSAAAYTGHLTTLKWLREQGCPWDAGAICDDAAESGSLDMLLYLKQQGCAYTEDTLSAAAGNGYLALCQ